MGKDSLFSFFFRELLENADTNAIINYYEVFEIGRGTGLKNTVKILGCRGSVSVSGAEFARYGGATSCVLVYLAGQPVLLDGGTGLLSLPSALPKQVLPLLLSHPHADHLLGLPVCPAVLDPGFGFQIWAEARGAYAPEAQVRALLSPPLWPVGPEELPAKLTFHTITGGFQLGAVGVDIFRGVHPGGVTGFRLTGGGKTIVYLPDCNLEKMEDAAEFARDCDLLLCDGQFAPADWAERSHFGHSTWLMAARLGSRCGAGQTRIIHHDPSATDAVLDRAAAQVAAEFPRCTFAYEGEEIRL